MSTRSAQNPPPSPSFTPTMPLASLYVVSGLPKRPQTWTLADPDAVQGLTHSDGAVGRWWRAEVLGSTVSPGVGGGKKKKVTKGHTSQTEVSKGPGALSKQETAKMLSKALKVSNSVLRSFLPHNVKNALLTISAFLASAFFHPGSRNHRVHAAAGFNGAYIHVHFTGPQHALGTTLNYWSLSPAELGLDYIDGQQPIFQCTILLRHLPVLICRHPCASLLSVPGTKQRIRS